MAAECDLYFVGCDEIIIAFKPQEGLYIYEDDAASFK
jgi:hypothetical protein